MQSSCLSRSRARIPDVYRATPSIEDAFDKTAGCDLPVHGVLLKALPLPVTLTGGGWALSGSSRYMLRAGRMSEPPGSLLGGVTVWPFQSPEESEKQVRGTMLENKRQWKE